MNVKSDCALILPGAVANGAFEAGVIQTLAEKKILINKIVATSSGALNGVAFAAGVRAGRTREMTSQLVNAWIKGGGWHNSLSFNPWNWLRGKGLSDSRGLLRMLNDLVTPCTSTDKHDVELRIIVSCIDGIEDQIGHAPATTYEKVFHFSGKDFDTEEGLKRIFEVTAAACAFPGLFAPVNIEGVGPCVDGGAVNNAPIAYALNEGDINRVIMPIPFPALAAPSSSWKGLRLANHVIEILINERLFRDLKIAYAINEDIRKLEKLKDQGVLNEEQLTKIKSELFIRKVEITQIRPTHSLGENSFSGFFSTKDRTMLVREGRKAALDTLSNPVF